MVSGIYIAIGTQPRGRWTSQCQGSHASTVAILSALGQLSKTLALSSARTISATKVLSSSM